MVPDHLVMACAFFFEHGGYSYRPGEETETEGRARCAMALASAESQAKERGLSVVWEDENEPWDGECDAPEILVWGAVYHPIHKREIIASLGMVGFDAWSDPYVRIVEAELFAEALGTLDREAMRDAADYQAERVTYASGGDHG